MLGQRLVALKLSNTLFLISNLVQPCRALTSLRPLLISIEGNIGAGKSTLIEQLKIVYPRWNFVDEPVGIWSKLKNDDGESLLEVFYRDRKRWSYTFQSCALLSRFQNIENSIRELASKKQHTFEDSSRLPGRREIFITERCLDTDYHVFTKMLRDENSIDKLESDIYDRLYQHLRSTSTPLGAILHVSTDPKECLKRIAGRNRFGEASISFEYLSNLEKYQTEWITSCNLPTLKSDDTSVILSQIASFVDQTVALSANSD